MTKLNRVQYLNPFTINGKTIDNIIFFNKNGPIVETGRGWFGNGNNNIYPDFEIPETKLARKDKTDACYYKTVCNASCFLYLYVDGEKIKQLPTTFKTEHMTAFEIWHEAAYSFEICGKTVTFEKLDHVEKTAAGEKVEDIKKMLTAESISLDEYTLRRLIEKGFDIIKR